MNIFNKIQRAFNIASDWRFNDKIIKLGEKSYKQNDIISVIQKLNLLTQQLTQKEIKNWRQANQYAIDIDNPKRILLYSIYDDAMHDLHLKGAIRNRKMAVLGKQFLIKDKKGKYNDDLIDLLNTRWFKQFISYSIDALFYGHSLIELTGIDRNNNKLKFNNVLLVPRHHVCPEYGVILKYATDWPDQGISYRQGSLVDTCIEVCRDIYDLGELNSVSKETISKKYILQFWDQFAEIFGMPLRIGKTTSRDPKDHAKIENMLDNMGAAAWGLFPEGTSIEVIGSKQGDAFEVYDRRIVRANSEISKAILGQTMTMDDGSSLSQAKVHESVAEEIAKMDREFIKDIVNDSLFPFLIKHGWPLQGYYFDWDEAYNYSPKEMKEIEDMLLRYYDIDQNYFIDKYGIKIIGKKQSSNQLESFIETDDDIKKNLMKMRLPDWVITMPEK
jgi:hypothetical protein